MLDFIGDDYIDSRDIIEEYEAVMAKLDDTDSLSESELEELLEAKQVLEDFIEQVKYCPYWEYGMTLIRDDCFTEYIKQMCKDMGYFDNDFPDWIVIDWEATAENCNSDYMTIEIDNYTYYAR